MRALLPLALLLAGCLDYEIEVETAIDDRGHARRTVKIREKGEKATWKRFLPPTAPYAVEGTEEEGFTATAALAPGRHGQGLRILLAEYAGDYEGARERLPAEEGVVAVGAEDLLVGTLYRYDETIALGTDLVRFRRELPQWLDKGLRLGLDTLRRKFPDLDFAPVEKHARETLLPRQEKSAFLLVLVVGRLFSEALAQGYDQSPEPWLAHPFADLVLDELGEYGVSFDARIAMEAGDLFHEGAWRLDDKLVDDFLAPLPAEARAAVKEAILHADEALEEEGDAALTALFPDREKLWAELRQFLSTAAGAYVVLGMFDEFDLRLRVTMPGLLLRTNGDLSSAPAIAWRLTHEDLAFARPQVFAYSFRPAEGFPEKAWRAKSLFAVSRALRPLDAEGRKALGELVAKARTAGWPDPEEDLGESAEAYDAIRAAVREAAGS